MNSSANRLRGSLLEKLAVSTIMLLVSLCCLPGIAKAQSASTSGQIVGQVLDTSGAAIAGAEVTIKNKNTNSTRNVTTDEAGRFTAPLLPVGPYEVKATASGFEPGIQEIIVTLGSSVSSNFNLAVGTASEVVEVSGGVNEISVEGTRTSARAVITDRQIKSLPINGRRFQDFILLTPSTTVEPSRGGISISGQRGINVNVNIDGADYNEPFFGGLRGGERSNNAFTVSQEAIQEFQVSRNTFSAEFGRSTGGVVNVVTKSGTNSFHGSAFYLFRNSDLTAEDALQRKPVAKQQQFGGSIGGPIIKDRTFFFAALDFQKIEEPLQVKYTALDTQKVRNTLPAMALLGVAPEDMFTKTNDAQAVLGRIDHRLFGNNNLSARFNYSNNTGDNAASAGGGVNTFTNSALSNNGKEGDRTYTFVSQLTSVISNNLINEFRFQYSRELRPREANDPIGPEVAVRNLGATVAVYGRLNFLPTDLTDDRYQFTDNVSVVKGAHTTKIGFDFNRVHVDQVFRAAAGGTYAFNSLNDYILRRPLTYRQFTGSGAFEDVQKELAFYFQDSWRVFKGVTLNPGFRYEVTFNPNLRPATNPMGQAPLTMEIADDRRQFAPRLGIAWDIGNKGQNVIRLGGGLFYARTPLLLFNLPITGNGGNPETGRTVAFNNTTDVLNAFKAAGINLATAPLDKLPIFTDAQLASFASGAAQAQVFQEDFRNPRSFQFNAAFEHQVTRGLTAGIDFAYINTTQLERIRDGNLPAPTKDLTGRRIYRSPRPFSKFSSIFIQESSARSLYRAMTTSLNFRRSRFVLDAYYTLSANYSDDDNERTSAGTGQTDDTNNLKNEYFYSTLDARHQFSINALVNLPHGFEISGSSRVSSGRPFNITAGSDLNGDGNSTDRPILNGITFKRNAGRNLSRSEVNLRLQKNFNLPNEKGRISFSAEMFNFLNQDNAQFAGPALVFGPGTAVVAGKAVVVPPSTNFMRLRDNNGRYLTSNTLGDPFQVQLGVRFQF